MIAGCIDRMSRDSCGGCERRDPCRSLARMFRLSEAPTERAPRSAHPFLAFLGSVAKAVEARAERRPSAFQREVEAKIVPMLAEGPVRIEEVALAMGLSRQTLYRRLKAEGATFERVLDGLRRRLGLKLIREEGVPVKEAAWRLGFSDPAAFSRAFKRWTGRSPSGMRPGQPG